VKVHVSGIFDILNVNEIPHISEKEQSLYMSDSVPKIRRSGEIDIPFILRVGRGPEAGS